MIAGQDGEGQDRRAAGDGRAGGGGGDRPHRADRDQRGRVRADPQGHAAEPAADVRPGAREDRGHVPAAGLAAEGRGDAAVLHRRAAGEPDRTAGRLPAGGAGERRPGAGERSPGARSAGAGAVAAVRGDGGVAAAARRRPGGHRGLRVRGGAVPAPPERRPGGAGVGAAAAAADRAAGAPAAGAPAGGARASRARRRAALGARGRGNAHRPARRRGGGAAAVGALQPDQGRQGPPHPELGRRAARRARRPERPGRAPARRRSG